MNKGAIDEEEGPENALRKLTSAYGVQNYVILNKTGIPIKYYGVEQAESLHQAALLSELTLATQNFLTSSAHLFQSSNQLELFSQDTELITLRLKSRKCEVIVTVDENYTLIVSHEPNATPQSHGLAAAALAPDESKKAGDKKGEKEESKTVE
jgi:hypothetical protein